MESRLHLPLPPCWFPVRNLGLQPAAAHTRAGHGCRYGWGCPNTGRRPYIEAQSDATSREYADGCNAAHIHSRVESNAIPGARPVSYTRANSYVDSPSVPDTGTNGSAESHGHANPYSDADADSAAHAEGYSVASRSCRLRQGVTRRR